MILWRTSNYVDLQGSGGKRASGRWHTRGRRIVYLAENPAAALLELLVHLEIDTNELPSTYRLLKVEVDDKIPYGEISLTSLPEDWRIQLELTRSLGDKWLHEKQWALLRVPSALTPETFNYLLNPLHPHSARVRILLVEQYPHDPRWLRK